MTIRRRTTIGLVVSSILAISSARAATPQGPLEGPSQTSAVPASPADPAKAPPRHAGKKKHVAAHHKSETGATSPAFGDSPAPDRPAPTSTADHRAPANANDALSLGMKWNGANDDGLKTRVQNYNGDAQGTGAEVGLKLHF